MDRKRLILAFLLAPAVTVACWTLLMVLLFVFVLGGSPNLASDLGFMAAAVGIFAYAHMIVLGVPVLYLLWRFGRLTLSAVAIASTLIGAVPFALFVAIYEVTLDHSGSSSVHNGVAHRIDGELTLAGYLSSLYTALVFAASGLLTGVAWWLIARPRRKPVAA
jgi:hypothetical protein